MAMVVRMKRQNRTALLPPIRDGDHHKLQLNAVYPLEVYGVAGMDADYVREGNSSVQSCVIG